MNPTPNVPLLLATLAHIQAHPEDWDQTVFRTSCGTAACFAGNVIVLSGENLSRTHCVDIRAQELLGITKDQAWGVHQGDAGLFDPNNTLEDIAAHVENIIAEAP